MIRWFLLKYTVVLALVVVSGAALMHVSHNVQEMEREVARLDQRIENEKENVRVLQAEWAYLNAPERLEMLATDYMDFVPPSVDHIVSDVQVLPDSAYFDEVSDDASALRAMRGVPSPVFEVTVLTKPSQAVSPQIINISTSPSRNYGGAR